MKRDKDWTDVMRDELHQTETAPPGDGWERLRRELASVDAAAAGNASRPVGLRLWPRFAAAAAAVLLCIVTGELLWHKGSEPAREVPVVAATGSGTDSHSISETQMPEIPESPGAAQGSLLAAALAENGSGENRRTLSVRRKGDASQHGPQPAARSLLSAGKSQQELLATNSPSRDYPNGVAETQPGEKAADGTVSLFPDTEHAVAEHPAAGSSAGSAAEVSSSERSAGTADRQTGTRRQSDSQLRNGSAPRYEREFVAYVPPRKKASFGLFAGGGVTGGGTGGLRSGSMLMYDVSSPSNGQVTALKRPEYAKESYKHRQPIGFGLSVRKEFAHGLSLESGVNYTLLRSDIRMQFSSEDISQQLHFIGIPLRMNWQFLQRSGFSLYIGAGGMVEKCVSAELGSRSVAQKGVQWSVHGAVGAEYRFAGPVGLYFEPEASYYLNDTSLPTARSESPLTLTLRLGVRFSF